MDRIGVVAGWRLSGPDDRVVPSQTRRGHCYSLPNCVLPLELVGARKISRRSLFRPGRGARVSISIVVVHVVAAAKNAAGLIAKAARLI